MYSYLMRCENLKTYQYHPSYRTIGKAVHLSPNTVAKLVNGLREKRLIVTGNTEIVTSRGEKRSGTLLYTICPVEEALRHFYEQQRKSCVATTTKNKFRFSLDIPKSLWYVFVLRKEVKRYGKEKARRGWTRPQTQGRTMGGPYRPRT